MRTDCDDPDTCYADCNDDNKVNIYDLVIMKTQTIMCVKSVAIPLRTKHPIRVLSVVLKKRSSERSIKEKDEGRCFSG